MRPNCYKIVLIGDYSVGKTSIVSWFVNNRAPSYSESTIGAAFFSITNNINGKSIVYNIWDTAGQERFRSLVRSYYKSSHVCICVFDLTSKTSVENIHYWINDYYNHCGDSIGDMVLVGNKSDNDKSLWVITESDIKELCNRYHCHYYLTECINGEGIHQMFQQIGKSLIKKNNSILEIEESPSTKTVDLTDTNKNNCCFF